MADEQDRESKTEEPTEKRIADALQRGNVPVARELTLLGSIAGLLCAVLLAGGWAASDFTRSLRMALEASGTMRLGDREAAASFLLSLLAEIAKPVVLFILLIAAGSLLATLMQNTPSSAAQRVQPQASRVSPLTGWNRLFGKTGLVEFAKASLKLIGVMVILWFLFRRDLPSLISALALDPAFLPETMQAMAVGVIGPILIFAAGLAIGDLVWSRYRWRRDLRMTLQEVKDEMKEAEGDPLIKARIRNLGRQRTSRRMLERLPTATMVITNPTHYAVALRYVREEGGAPVVVAKGVDHLALRIREAAEAHHVPLVENRPLARSLHDQVEIDEQIPPEFYHAVAEIIHYLNRTGRLPRARLN